MIDWGDLAPLIIAVIGGGGLVGAVAAFLKIRPEAGQIAVNASQGALIVQTGVIDTLREENHQLRERLEDLESKVAMLGSLQDRVATLEAERTRLRMENTTLRNRVKHLEERLSALGYSES